MADVFTVPAPRPGWATVVYQDERTGAVGQIPVRVELLPAEVLKAIGDGLDVVVRSRAAEILGLDSWLDVTPERAVDVVAAAR